MDVTDRLKAQQALEASEANYRQLVENVNSIILRMDTEGRITFINDYALRFFGYSEKDLLYRSAFDTIVPRTETGGRDLGVVMNDLLVHPDDYGIPCQRKHPPNGERVWINWPNRPLLMNRAGLSHSLRWATTSPP